MGVERSPKKDDKATFDTGQGATSKRGIKRDNAAGTAQSVGAVSLVTGTKPKKTNKEEYGKTYLLGDVDVQNIDKKRIVTTAQEW
jgi:hypothetical protein